MKGDYWFWVIAAIVMLAGIGVMTILLSIVEGCTYIVERMA